MFWNLAPFIITICSIFISIYVYKVVPRKRYFWSTLALSGINLLGGSLLAIGINFNVGLVLLIIPLSIMLSGFYKKRTSRSR
ncbi:hypothetical protein [Alkalihalobacillus sp. LMS39]|uniref:hypothetical protein n=1 Tax=Alkalihalobacillus sp. LMS39 TaxID=2924032 RepID=UPI001FB40C6C|nr:hypothetical protein [Alkalihalobacillus sp. LMS39]UOE95168.1 hypothetical protein MM271_05960 [Alkalihalobacillus sp. LMS39]